MNVLIQEKSTEDCDKGLINLVTKIIDSLPAGCSTNEALNGLMSAYLTVGVRTSNAPTLINALKTAARSLETNYEVGMTGMRTETTLEDLGKTEEQIAGALIDRFIAAVPAGTPHKLVSLALLARFSAQVQLHPCCLPLFAGLAQDVADRLKAAVGQSAPASVLH